MTYLRTNTSTGIVKNEITATTKIPGQVYMRQMIDQDNHILTMVVNADEKMITKATVPATLSPTKIGPIWSVRIVEE
jgi:hypothetical protein